MTAEITPGITEVTAAPGTVAEAAPPGEAATLAPRKTNRGAVFQEEQNGSGSDAAVAPVLAAPSKMTNRSIRLNVAGAGARARGVDVVVVIAMDFAAGKEEPPSAYDAHFGRIELLLERTTTVISRQIRTDYVNGR